MRRPSVILVAALLTVLPDIDALGYHLGIPYPHMLGHRGLTHSLPFAVSVALLAAWPLARWLQLSPFRVWMFFAVSIASHGVLDAMTNGGLGIAFFAPFSNQRFFFPFRPLQVSPLSLNRFDGAKALGILENELIYVWLPAITLAVIGVLISALMRSDRARSTGSAARAS